MKTLNGGDVFHLHREDSGQPAHTIKVAVLAPGSGALDPDEVAAWARVTLPEREPFRWQLQAVPLRLGRPVWVDAPAIEPADHVRRRSLAHPAGLDELVGELAGDPLPRDRPLWRLWVVDGLEAGRVALLLQVHHALADGAASVRIWEDLFGDDERGEHAGPPVSAARLVTGALRRHGRSLRHFPALLVRLRASDQRRKADPEDAPPVTDYFESPPSPFNAPLSTDRTCAFVTLPFDDVRSLRRTLGGTVNDVYAALCSGALRAYLDERGELPEEPLTATAPVGLEERDGPYGNATSSWFWSMATDEADPLRRFEAIRSSLAAGRDLQEQDPAMLADLQDHAVLYETLWRAMALREVRKGSPMFNAIVSNVQGPEPLSWRGHPVVALRSVGPLTGRMGLNFTAWSYRGDFTVGLHACRQAAPDLDRLAALLAEELEVLAAAAAAG